MRDLNISFLDLYKRVDKFIREAYFSAEGVSEYIKRMENDSFTGWRFVSSWRDDYTMLKRLRWIRNQLSHDVDFDSDICTRDDYDWLVKFRDRLFSSEDPLAIMKKALEAERQKEIEQRRKKQQEQQQQKSKASASSSKTIDFDRIGSKLESWWNKMKNYFTGK